MKWGRLMTKRSILPRPPEVLLLSIASGRIAPRCSYIFQRGGRRIASKSQSLAPGSRSQARPAGPRGVGVGDGGMALGCQGACSCKAVTAPPTARPASRGALAAERSAVRDDAAAGSATVDDAAATPGRRGHAVSRRRPLQLCYTPRLQSQRRVYGWRVPVQQGLGVRGL